MLVKQWDEKEKIQKFKASFLKLEEEAQDDILRILRALLFAQDTLMKEKKKR